MRRTWTAIASVFLWGSLASEAHAGFKTGNDLYEDCTADEKSDLGPLHAGMCEAYVAGAFDGQWFFVKGQNPPLYCVPSGVILNQAKDVFVGYLQRHPEKRQLTAGFLVTLAMMEAFPCKPKA